MTDERKSNGPVWIFGVTVVMFATGCLIGSKSKEATMRVADNHAARQESTEAYIIGVCAGGKHNPENCDATIRSEGHEYHIRQGKLFERNDFGTNEHLVSMLPDVCTGFKPNFDVYATAESTQENRGCSVSINRD